MTGRTNTLRNLSFMFPIVLFVLGCNSSSPESQKARHLERAASFLEKGQLQEALIEYMNVTKTDPANAEAYYQMALIHLKLGGITNLQKAFAELNRTLELNKDNRDARLKIGELYLMGNEPAKAREQVDLILASAPQDRDALAIRGRSLINERRYQEGIVELKKLLALDPTDPGVYIELSRAYFFANDRASAEAILRQGLTANPSSLDLPLAMGDLHLSSGKPDQAESMFKRVVDIAPDNEPARLRLATFYQLTNKPAEAEAVLQQWAAAYPQDERPHVHLGDFFTSLGVRDKALASYQQALQVNATSAVARDKLISLLLDLGKTNEAEPQIKSILEKNARDLSGRFFNARLSLAKGKVDEAITLFQTLANEEAQFAPAHYFLGIAYLRNRQIPQARAAFTQAVKLNPAMPEARTALAELFLNEGSFDLALEHAQAAVQLNPRNVSAAFIAGDAYLRKGDFAKSKQVYQAIGNALPKEALVPYRLGLVARAEKNDAKAIAYFEEALALKPGAIEPIVQIAAIKVAQGKPVEGRERLLRQMAAAPQSAQHENLLGELWLATQNLDQAEKSFKKAIELDNSLLVAYMNLGQLYYQTEKIDQAAAEYQAVVDKEPQAIQAHMMLGVIHEQKREYEKAKARYEKILAMNHKFAPAANNLAWLLVEQGGNLDVALNYAQTAREQQPNDPAIADTIGWLYYKKNAYVLAISLLKEAAEKLPTNPVVHYHLGMAQYKNGDKDGAKKSLHLALKLDRHFPGADEAQRILSEL
ncbi:MAG: tetratricopeptide repeat protein [Nitrospira sp.]|nr:tetratricopeptide repeat protein [Nitrospira sp.]MCP9443185.1 tetratricopeptide repeat protein [Nitrospira sp.]